MCIRDSYKEFFFGYSNYFDEGDEKNMKFKPFDNKVWLSSPTMHGEELEYVKEAYETNWMSTVGVNINEVEKMCIRDRSNIY